MGVEVLEELEVEVLVGLVVVDLVVMDLEAVGVRAL